MSEEKKDDTKKTLSLGGKLSLKAGAGSSGAQVRQSFSGGGSKTVAVEVKRRRNPAGAAPLNNDRVNNANSSVAPTTHMGSARQGASPTSDATNSLSDRETEARAAALARAQNSSGLSKTAPRPGVGRPQIVERPTYEPKKPQSARDNQTATVAPTELPQTEAQRRDSRSNYAKRDTNDDGRKQSPKSPPKDLGELENRRMANLTVTQALNRDYDKATTGPSLSSVRRRRKNRMQSASNVDAVKQFREVTLPETITVQELANRMTERAGNVIKSLMKMGVMATVNQSIDADTAELIIIEFGHSVKRVTEADVEIGIEGDIDNPKDLKPRPPVVTIMGHVDHGKTSLLDAFRETNVVSGEAGGITQHIGAYQIKDSNGDKITFLDTPGHAAFTEMRSRGANVTDIVVIVVAANDSLKPQSIEAIQHAKAGEVPMIIAINKIDLADANPQKVMTDLLSHEVIVEQMGGDVQCVEISALKKTNLDKLEEAILLQAELLELKANPNRNAVGRVIEAKVEIGRGSVATVLIQKGTLKVGDIFVCGAESGRVRALLNDQGKPIKKAEPSLPVEVLGLQGTPQAGDDFVVVEDDTKARKIADYRARKKKESETALAPTSAENFFAQVKEGEKKELPILVKADVHGSTEAIISAINKVAGEQDEVKVRTLLSGVGAITESDVTLAGASNAIIIGFNVRANAQARQLAEGNGTTIKYYNVIYNILDDIKGLISGLFAPIIREEFIGNAKIKEVFNITKVGKIAGCMVAEGYVKRGAKVRLLRDDVVIHEGTLKTLKRHKDEVKEVKEGTECGMAFENYEDIREGDVIECFDVITEQKTME